ncbi:M50 family metallopeptidase [Luedemannella helvata]|uniref:M50 family metallopeptidase n=1 Tax=Luedemannella helvata TaxID=349315 RepID=UPI0031D05629
MAVGRTQISVWEALAGRAPGRPTGPADPGLWAAVAERINPTKARPQLRDGIERADLVSVRGVPYVMLRSPDHGNGRRGSAPCYLRLAPEEVALAELMDGTRTLARLVADFARISGQLAPDRVRRVVADLAGNRMLEELPVDAFKPLARVRRDPWPLRLGRAMLAFAQGRRMIVANIDPVLSFAYRAGGWLLFTRPVAVLLATIAVVGLGAFGWLWWGGEHSVFLNGQSYVTGAAILLGLNVFALACHELGHGLAAKHAGRRVPVAGFLIYFGIPSVFVDTTDVWMGGRRARIRTTAAGPAAGLVLAGASALVGVTNPALAPWCFKLCFAWYVNALFNLNPFLALDGYYLVMDWLEVPNLRARGLAWVTARVRRKPPRWRALDREGRLVALYGLLSIAWLVIAANIAYRVYVDRVAGLIVGLWRTGWLAQLLVVGVIAALCAPMIYLLCTWLNRHRRRIVDRWRERRDAADVPRREHALRQSTLGELSPAALADLAARATWLHPRPGEQLISARQPVPTVYAVVDGALEGRAPGDPGGTVRERVGVGGVVGLGSALTGAPSALTWHAAGTRLLALPAVSVAAHVRPHTESLSVALAAATETEALLARAPALAGLTYEDRLGLAAAARPVTLAPGQPVMLDDAETAVLVMAGMVEVAGRRTHGPGMVIGPTGEQGVSEVGVARTPVQMLVMPAVSGLPLLLGASEHALRAEAEGREAGRAPVFGVHPPAAYPPMAVPPGPPPTTVDVDRDRWFEKRMRWLLLLILLIGLLLTGGNLIAPFAWAEMPSDRVLLSVEDGTVTARQNGRLVRLAEGDKLYLAAADEVTVDDKSTALLTYRGGAWSRACAGTHLVLGELVSTGRPLTPSADLRLDRGLLVTDTHSRGTAFTPLAPRQNSPAGVVESTGEAWFAVSASGVAVARGSVTRNGEPVERTARAVGCFGADYDSPPTPGTTEPPLLVPTDELTTDLPTQTPDASLPPSGVPSASPGTTQTTVPTTDPGPVTTPGSHITTPPVPTTTRPTTTRPTTSAPVTTRTNAPPTVRVGVSSATIYANRCRATPHETTVNVTLGDDGGLANLTVTYTWSIPDLNEPGQGGWSGRNGSFTVAPTSNPNLDSKYSLIVSVVAHDRQGRSTTVMRTLTFVTCTTVIR